MVKVLKPFFYSIVEFIIADETGIRNHIMAHYYDVPSMKQYEGPSNKNFKGNPIRIYMEGRAVAIENLLRQQFGNTPLRRYYTGDFDKIDLKDLLEINYLMIQFQMKLK